MFNRLESLGFIHGARVLDLFAGSGALGIEAISRGAESVVFVDNDTVAVRVINTNLSALSMTATVHRMAASRYLETRDNAGSEEGTPPFDVAFLDPPYDFVGWPELLELVPATVAVVESDRPVEASPDWTIVKASAYGKTRVVVFERTSAAPQLP